MSSKLTLIQTYETTVIPEYTHPFLNISPVTRLTLNNEIKIEAGHKYTFNTTNEGMVNNSNQPSQTEKLNGMINKKITDLTEKLGKIGSEINELKQINVTDEITKIVVGSTEFNIEDFMSEPDIHKYRNWLEVKKELEGKSEEDIDDLTGQSKSELWENGWVEYITDNYSPSDVVYDPFDYIEFDEFLYNHLHSDSYDVSNIKDSFIENQDDKQILESIISERIS